VILQNNNSSYGSCRPKKTSPVCLSKKGQFSLEKKREKKEKKRLLVLKKCSVKQEKKKT